MLTEAEKNEIGELLRRNHDPRSAGVEAMKIVQAHRGWVSDEAIRDVAALVDMSPDELDSAATFYSLIFRRPVGKHVIKVCDSLVCWSLGFTPSGVEGSQSLLGYLERKLGVKAGETTADGRFTLLPICCLGDCDHAPVMMVDDRPVRNLTPEVLDSVLAEYAAEEG
jgi:NADH-quinone oxidoreductase subunit E